MRTILSIIIIMAGLQISRGVTDHFQIRQELQQHTVSGSLPTGELHRIAVNPQQSKRRVWFPHYPLFNGSPSFALQGSVRFYLSQALVGEIPFATQYGQTLTSPPGVCVTSSGMISTATSHVSVASAGPTLTVFDPASFTRFETMQPFDLKLECDQIAYNLDEGKTGNAYPVWTGIICLSEYL